MTVTCQDVFIYEKKVVYLFAYFFFSCVYFGMKRLDLCFSTQRLAAPNARRILRRRSASIICCFSLAIYFLHCFGRLNSPPPTPPLPPPPPPPSQSHSCFSLTLSSSPFAVIWQLHCFLSLARKEDGESKRRL